MFVSAHAEYNREDCAYASRKSVAIETEITAKSQEIVKIATMLGAGGIRTSNAKAKQIVDQNLDEIFQLRAQFSSVNELALKSCQ